MGPACEFLPIAAGAWSYASQEVLGMPGWLPLAYALLAALAARAALAFSSILLAGRL